MRLARAPRPRQPFAPRSRFAIIASVSLASATLISATLARGHRSGQESLHERIGAIIAAERPFPARFGASGQWSACSVGNDAARRHGGHCGNYRASVDRLREAYALVAQPSAPPDDAAWQRSVLDLSVEPSPDQIDAAIGRLSELAARHPSKADLLNDLAVAHLARAAARDEAQSRLEALDAIERAYLVDSTASVVAFNRALILQGLHLIDEAEDAWTGYTRRERDRGWRDEAAANLSAIRQARGESKFRPTAVPIDSAIHADPQGAREYAIDSLTADWAHAAGRNAADSIARLMLRIGQALAARAGDSSALHVARSIASGRSTPAAVASLSAGSAAFRQGQYAHAKPALVIAVRVLRARGAQPLGDWGAVLLSGIDMYSGRYEASDRRMLSIARAARDRGDLALEARALWVLGLSEEKRGLTGEAIDNTAAAESLFHVLGERENEAVMRSQRADAQFLLGRDQLWIDAKLQVLADLDAPRHALRRAGLLTDLGKQIAAAGLPFAGIAILREAVQASSATGRPSDHAEALIRLARAEFDAGERGAAERTLDAARPAVAGVSDPLMRDRMQMELAQTGAAVAEQNQPALAVELLSRVIAYFDAQHLGYDAAAPLIQRAQARLRTSDSAGARRDLQAAIGAIESQADIRNDPVAARDAAAVRSEAFHELVALESANPERALRLAQQGRGDEADHVSLPGASDVTLVYEALYDRTIMWVLTSAGVRMQSLPVAASRLDSLAGALELALRTDRIAGDAGDPSRALFDAVIAPAETELHGARRLTVIADGPLARIPFAALRDQAGRLIVERLALRYASRLGDAPERAPRVGTVAIVGDPAFDPALFPELSPLRGADSEARSVESVYPRATVLAGTGAVKPTVVAALGRASIVHFAGHAVRVDRAPSLSSLVLARQPGGFAANTLSAAELTRLDLRHLALVVLSSCGTMAPGRRAAGETGLATAFLDAGAGAVVSSIWDVDDDATAPLMSAFHQRLAAGAPPDIALQQAQLEMLRRSAGQDAGTWAAFRVETR